MNRKQFSIMTLAIIGAISFSSCKRQMQMPVSNNYPTMTVGLTTQTVQSEYAASVKGCNDVDIFPQVSGNITRICVKEGAHVSRNQTLFVINPVPYRAVYQNAQANVKSAEANLATAKMTWESKRNLYNEKVVSTYDLTQATNSYHSAQASLAQAQADLTKAANNLSYTEVKSPVSGVIGMISLRVGALVSEQMTEPLVSVSDDSSMWVYFSLTEKQVLGMSRRDGKWVDIASTMPAVSLRLSDGTAYDSPGTIDAVSGLVDKQTGSVSVRATFSNPDHVLRSGSSATVIVPQEMKDCISIPQAATFEIQDKIYVYKVIDGKTQSAEIKTTNMNDGKSYIVTAGLKAGDVIISDGAGLLKEGLTVETKPKQAKQMKQTK